MTYDERTTTYNPNARVETVTPATRVETVAPTSHVDTYSRAERVDAVRAIPSPRSGPMVGSEDYAMMAGVVVMIWGPLLLGAFRH